MLPEWTRVKLAVVAGVFPDGTAFVLTESASTARP